MQRALDLLREFGPMTAKELAVELGWKGIGTASIVLQQLKGEIHICQYTYEHAGQKRYPRAMYAAGPGEDAKKPRAPSLRENSRLYRKRKALKVRSIFETGARPIRLEVRSC